MIQAHHHVYAILFGENMLNIVVWTIIIYTQTSTFINTFHSEKAYPNY